MNEQSRAALRIVFRNRRNMGVKDSTPKRIPQILGFPFSHDIPLADRMLVFSNKKYVVGDSILFVNTDEKDFVSPYVYEITNVTDWNSIHPERYEIQVVKRGGIVNKEKETEFLQKIMEEMHEDY